MMKKSFGIGKHLETALTETVLIAKEKAGKLRVESVPVSKIVLDPDNPRQLSISIEDVMHGIKAEDKLFEKKKQEKEDLASLSNSIKNHDLMNPILIYKEKDQYKVIAGERRTLATILSGNQSIFARVLDEKPSKKTIAILQWIENMERKNLSLWERMLNVEKIIKESSIEISATNIADLLGCSVTQGQAYASLMKIKNPQLRNLIESGQVNSIDKALILAKLEDQEFHKIIKQDELSRLNKQQLKNKVIGKESNSKSKKGLKQKIIKIGETKNVKVAKQIWESLKKNQELKDAMNMISEPDWRNLKEINKTFSDAIYFLEESYNARG